MRHICLILLLLAGRLGPVPVGASGASRLDRPGSTCGVRRTEVPAWPLSTFVFEPTGPGACGATGRPVILFGHGNTATWVGAYESLIDHLVGQGFVVVLARYQTDMDPPAMYAQADAGFRAGVAALAPGRADVSRLGFVGHSFGAGMIPRQIQLAAGRGWGSRALWAVALAPGFVDGVGAGAITGIPAHTRLLTVNYQEDVFVDMGIANELVRALPVAGAHTHQLVVLTAGDHLSNHFDPLAIATPLPFPFPFVLPWGLGTDDQDRRATWPAIDAWAACALDPDLPADRPCDRPLVTDWPVLSGNRLADVGPPALSECESWLSPRRCSFP